MLSDPRHHSEPFPFFSCERALGAARSAIFDELFAADADWQAREDSFYSCFLRDVSVEVPPEVLGDVLGRMRALTGLPLTDQVAVSIQRMEPGQAVGVHSDRPLLGYEAVRLVLQLNRDWRPEDGGLLQLYESPEAPPIVSLEPGFDVAFGFSLSEDSHHGVTRVHQTRRSVVFNFWHAANTPELAEAVTALFADMHFSALPRSLDPVAVAAEASLPEDTTFRASLAAFALRRWGLDDDTIIEGYRVSAGLSDQRRPRVMNERAAAVLLADWIARLETQSFDLTRWQELRCALGSVRPSPELTPLWRMCFPSPELRGGSVPT